MDVGRLTIPDVGDCFEHHGLCHHQSGEPCSWDRSYRVTGWLKRAPVKYPECYRAAGPDNVPLVFCVQDEAEYVSGYGTCGVIVRVSEVTVTGRVPWAEKTLAGERRMAELHIGTMVT